MLQPTSPLRNPGNVRDCLNKLVVEDLDAVWTVSETDSKSHPLKQLTLGESGELGYYDPAGASIIARQQLQPVYHRNGIAYAISRECLLGQRTIMGRKSAGLVVPGVHVSIDTPVSYTHLDVYKRQGSGYVHDVYAVRRGVCRSDHRDGV